MILWIITIILLLIFLLSNITLPAEKGNKMAFWDSLSSGIYSNYAYMGGRFKKEVLYAIAICNLLLLADAGTLYLKNKEDKKVLLYALSEAFVISIFNILMIVIFILW